MEAIFDRKGFASRLRELCAARGMKQAELATRLHVSSGYISKLLAASMAPSVEFLMMLHETFDVSLGWLCIGVEDDSSDPLCADVDRLTHEVARLRERVAEREARYQPQRLEWIALQDGGGRLSPASDEMIQIPVLSYVPCPPASTGDSVLISTYVCYEASVPHAADSVCCYLEDDGMTPLLPRGSLVCVDRFETAPQQLAGQIVALTTEHQTCARRLGIVGDHYVFGGSADVEPIIVPRSATPPIAGRVIWGWMTFP